MKKHLRFFLIALFALVGMTSWAETHVWDPAALTDGTIISLQCRDTNGGSNYFFNGGEVKSATFSYANLYRVVADGSKIKLQRVSDGKFVSSASPVTMVDGSASNVASFRVVNEQATGWTTTVAGTDQTKTLRFYLGDSDNKLNCQPAGNVPTYISGTGGYSIWYVYTYTQAEVDALVPEPDTAVRVVTLRNNKNNNYLMAKDGELWTNSKAGVAFNKRDAQFQWIIYHTEAGDMLYSVSENKVANDTQGVSGQSNHWVLVGLDTPSYIVTTTNGATYAFRDADYSGGYAWLHNNDAYATGITNWTEASDPSRWVIEEVFTIPEENAGSLDDIRAYLVEYQATVGRYYSLLDQAQADIDFAKSTESRNILDEWLVTDASKIYSPKTETPDREPGSGVQCLIDDNTNTYWHSSWAAAVDFGSAAQMEHYLQFDLGKPCQALNMKYANRKNVANDAPSAFSITASTTIDGTYTEVATITGVGKQDGTIFNYTFDMGAEYQYIRVRATAAHGSLQRGYWHCSEMNFCEYTVEEGAKLYTRAGDIATQLEAILANPSENPTQEEIETLQALYDQLHALIHDIDQYRGIPGKVNMYNGMRATDEQVAALEEAIENYDASAAKAIVDALEAVDNARTAFTLVCERGSLFAVKKDGANLLVSSNNRWNIELTGEDYDKWAFVSFNGGTYLYNVGAKLFFNADRTLSATPDANAIAVEELNRTAAYPFVIKSGTNYFNTQVAGNTSGGADYDAGVVVNYWGGNGMWDDGNQYKIAVAADFDPAVAVEVLIAAQAQADTDRLEALQADMTQFIAGKEEYISADVRQAIETILGDSWITSIYGAYQDAVENSAAYVSPDFWETLEGQIAWVKEQINGVQNGTVALYTETGVVGGDPQFAGTPYFNTEVGVEVYTNHITIKAWDGVEGSDLTVAYTGLAVGDETITRIIGIEQTVNGEVVSQVFEDEDLDVDDEQSLTVTLFPQAGDFASFTVFPNMEMNGILLGEGEEAGMGQLLLFGIWQYPADEAKDPVQAPYSVVWPGSAVEIPVATLTLSYEFNEGKTQATVSVDGLTGKGTAVYFLDDDFEEVAGMVEDGTFTVAPITTPATIKVTVREYSDDFSTIYAQGELTIDFPEVADDEPLYTTTNNLIAFDEALDEQGFVNFGLDASSSAIQVYDDYLVILNFLGVEGCNLRCDFTTDPDSRETLIYSVSLAGDESAAVRTLDDEMGIGGSTVAVGERQFNFGMGMAEIAELGGWIKLNMTEQTAEGNVDGYYYAAWGEVATAIRNAQAEVGNAAIYNLQGQRINAAQRGINIVNGAKVVVK